MCCNATIRHQRPQYDSYRAHKRGLIKICHATKKMGLVTLAITISSDEVCNLGTYRFNPKLLQNRLIDIVKALLKVKFVISIRVFVFRLCEYCIYGVFKSSATPVSCDSSCTELLSFALFAVCWSSPDTSEKLEKQSFACDSPPNGKILQKSL